MTRKRKAGFGSVLSALPQDVRLAFAPTPSNATEEGESQTTYSSADDLIVQRVHVAQPVQKAGSLALAAVIEEGETVADAPTPARKKQKLSKSQKLVSPPTFPSDDISTAGILHYKTQKSVPQHLKKCEYFYTSSGTRQ